MILYFSGTGNSQFVAEKIAKTTGDVLVSLNQLIKQSDFSSLVSQNSPFVFVAPIYAWRIPKIVENFIEKVDFDGTTQVYFVVTCGAESSNAVSYIEKLCVKKQWKLKGFSEIVMPNNYLVMSDIDSDEDIEKIVKQAIPQIEKTANAIKNNASFRFYKSNKALGKIESSLVNPLFYSFFVHASGFHTNEKCISCGKCATICPLNNITMVDKKPIWGKNCTHCMACICQCPTQAIEYKNATQKRKRYLFKE